MSLIKTGFCREAATAALLIILPAGSRCCWELAARFATATNKGEAVFAEALAIGLGTVVRVAACAN
jgi:hypothetical protein